jgi:4-carboxymuconolactone decarboxylase
MSKLPSRYVAFLENYPSIGEAYASIGKAVADAGPLDRKTRELVKLGISIAANQEGGTHSHARKAMDAGATPEELRHVALQALTTIGFPNMMKGLSWVEDVLGESQEDRADLGAAPETSDEPYP